MEDNVEFGRQVEEQKSLDGIFARTFGDEDGIRALKDLKDKCMKDKNAFRENHRMEAFILGMQSVYEYIEDRLNGEFTKSFVEKQDAIKSNYMGV